MPSIAFQMTEIAIEILEILETKTKICTVKTPIVACVVLITTVAR